MLLNYVIAVLLVLFFVCLISCYDKDKEEQHFKIYFRKAYQLRLKDDQQNGTSKHHRLRRNVVEKPTQMLERAFDHYQEASKLEKFEKVSRNGTTDEQLDLIAEEIWDRAGADLVEKSLKLVGAKVGTQIGGYVGGKYQIINPLNSYIYSHQAKNLNC